MLVAVIAPLVLLALVWSSRATVWAGLGAVRRADGQWLAAAAVASVGTWIAASCCQFGSTTARLSVPTVFAVQVAGSFVNHVLPAGAGIAALNLRMLRRHGLSPERATAAVSLNTGAGIVLHGLALVVLLATGRATGRAAIPILVIGVVAAGLTLLAWRVTRSAGRWSARLKELLREGVRVARRPGRCVLLWLGSAAIPMLHIVVLLAVLRGIGEPAPLLPIAAAYLSAGAIAALLPSPGGFGGLDLALVGALTAAHQSPATAVGAVVGYRLITVWLPLLPGLATLLVLMRRGTV